MFIPVYRLGIENVEQQNETPTLLKKHMVRATNFQLLQPCICEFVQDEIN